MSDNQAEPKIVVDDDWKAKVQAEKEAAAAAKQAPPQPQAERTPESGAERRLPPASLELLISTLASQALVAMGKIPDPVAGHPVVRPDMAKHYIDTLSILEQKTKGNLTPDEADLLSAALHELRMLFVTTRAPAAEPKGN